MSASHFLDGRRGVDQNSTFSEHGHVAYQIKGNHEFSRVKANILIAISYPLPASFDPGVGIKRSNSTFSENGHVALSLPRSIFQILTCLI